MYVCMYVLQTLHDYRTILQFRSQSEWWSPGRLFLLLSPQTKSFMVWPFKWNLKLKIRDFRGFSTVLSTFAVCQYRAVRKDRSIFEKRKRKKKGVYKKERENRKEKKRTWRKRLWGVDRVFVPGFKSYNYPQIVSPNRIARFFLSVCAVFLLVKSFPSLPLLLILSM